MKTILALLFLTQVSFAAGKLQNEDFKTRAQLEAAGGSVSQLLNDTKIFVTSGGINKQLSVAISDGDIGGGIALDVVGSSPNASAATISGDVLNLQPADGVNPGVMTAVSQSIGGDKKFGGQMMVGSLTAASISDSAFQVSGTNRGSRPFPKVPTASISAMESGVMTYDTVMNQPAYFDGTQWVGLSGVSQATLYGSMTQTGAASCNHLENTSTGLTDYDQITGASGCNAWSTSGAISATGTNQIGFSFSNMPPGEYRFELAGYIESNTANQTCFFRLNDGTNQSNRAVLYNSGGAIASAPLSFTMSYTSAANRTFTLEAADDGAGRCGVNNAASSYQASWRVYRYPSYSETAVRMNQNPNYYSGYHDSTCSWSRTNTAYGAFTADASCALVDRNKSDITAATTGSVLPTLAVTFPRLGTYFVCAKMSVFGSVSTGHGIRLTDGTSVLSEGSDTSNAETDEKTLCGVYTTTSLTPTFTLEGKAASGSIVVQSQASGPAVEWTIFPISPNLQMPVFVGSVTSSSAGAERIERFKGTCSGSSVINSSIPGVTMGNQVSSCCDITLPSAPWSDTSQTSCTMGTTNAGTATSIVVSSSFFSTTGITVCGSSGSSNAFSMTCQGPR